MNPSRKLLRVLALGARGLSCRDESRFLANVWSWLYEGILQYRRLERKASELRRQPSLASFEKARHAGSFLSGPKKMLVQGFGSSFVDSVPFPLLPACACMG